VYELNKYKKSTKKKIIAIIGGTHMVRYTPQEVIHVANQLENVYDCPDLYLNHCTDKLPIPFIKKPKQLIFLKNDLDKKK